MELDSLKYGWQLMAASRNRTEEDRQIRSLLQRRSAGLAAKMRRNLYGELLLIGAIYTPAILYYTFDAEGRLSSIAWMLVVLLVFFAVYFHGKNRLLEKLQYAGSPTRAYLQQQVDSLRTYTRFYTVAGTLMIPVMAVLSYLVVRRAYPPAAGTTLYYQLIGHSWQRDPLVWIVLLALLTIGIYYINAWYVHRLYGRHIRRLQEVLRQIEEE